MTIRLKVRLLFAPPQKSGFITQNNLWLFVALGMNFQRKVHKVDLIKLKIYVFYS